jgi:hypothetical protein
MGSSSGSSSHTRNFLLAPYKAILDAVNLPSTQINMLFVEGLHHMGWSPFNPTMGFRIDSNASGSTTSRGALPNWLPNLSTYLQCWGNFMADIEAKGGDPAMRDNMSALQRMITTFVPTHGDDPDFAWHVAAHIIMGRVHNYCATMQPDALGASLTNEEERQAVARTKAVKRPFHPKDAQQPFRREMVSAGPSRFKKPRRDSNPPPNRGGGGRPAGCPFHPGASHPISECRRFLDLAKQHNGAPSSAADRSG